MKKKGAMTKHPQGEEGDDDYDQPIGKANFLDEGDSKQSLLRTLALIFSYYTFWTIRLRWR